MPAYETMIIFNPLLDEEGFQAEMQKVQEFIAGQGGEVTKADLWGKRKLAYPINKQSEGYYSLLVFNGAAELVRELERTLKYAENVMRHLLINLTEEE